MAPERQAAQRVAATEGYEASDEEEELPKPELSRIEMVPIPTGLSPETVELANKFKPGAEVAAAAKPKKPRAKKAVPVEGGVVEAKPRKKNQWSIFQTAYKDLPEIKSLPVEERPSRSVLYQRLKTENPARLEEIVSGNYGEEEKKD